MKKNRKKKKVFPIAAGKVKFTQTQIHKSLNASLKVSVTGSVEVINNWKKSFFKSHTKILSTQHNSVSLLAQAK